MKSMPSPECGGEVFERVTTGKIFRQVCNLEQGENGEILTHPAVVVVSLKALDLFTFSCR